MTDYKLIEKVAKLSETLTEKIGVLNKVLDKRVKELNATLKEASKASGDLADVLNRLTFWGLIVAGAGVFVAFASLIFEVIKYLNGNV